MKPLRKSSAGLAVYLVFTLVFACTAQPQQSAPASDNSSASAVEASTDIDQKAHGAAVRLTEALGLKEQMTTGIDADLDKGVAAMKTQLPNLPSEFTDEWRKRMKARMKPEDFVEIVVRIYVKHFTADELDQLRNVVINKKLGKTVQLSDALKEKFQKNAVVIQSEIIGGTTQLGARLGGEIGVEIQKDHPEWVPKATQPVK